jgi:hypothetical protein
MANARPYRERGIRETRGIRDLMIAPFVQELESP